MERPPGIFLSHNHRDKGFVRTLAHDLSRYGIRIWLDEAEMLIGDSLIEKIRSGIDEMDYVAVVLSRNSVDSGWVRREVDIAMNQEIEGHRVKVLPLLIDDCQLPGFLLGKLYADFRTSGNYSVALEQVLRRLGIILPAVGTKIGDNSSEDINVKEPSKAPEAGTAPKSMDKDPFWNAPTIDVWNSAGIPRSLARRTIALAPDKREHLLLVFIHGYNGHPDKTWGDLPRLILGQMGVDSDALSFSYPTGRLSHVSIDLAASQLRSLLVERFQYHRHIIFVTHGMGGLVAKEVLRQDMRVAKGQAARNNKVFPSTSADGSAVLLHTEWQAFPSLTCRVRRIFNFAVPHLGTSRSMTFRLWINEIINLIVYPFTRLLKMWREGYIPYGRNRALRQLMANNKWATKLDQEYMALVSSLDQCQQPHPVSIEILAFDPPVAAAYQVDEALKQVEGNTFRIRGAHLDVDLPAAIDDQIYRFVANRISYLTDYACTTIAYLTWRRISEIDADDALSKLAEGFGLAEAVGDRPGGVRAGEWRGGSQREVVEHLYAAFISHPLGSRKRIVTGDAGVGKSVVLRQLARRMAVDILVQPTTREPIPMFLPLQQLKRDDLERTRGSSFSPQELWSCLLGYWVDYVRSLIRDAMPPSREAATSHDAPPVTGEDVVPREWISRMLGDGRLLVILDGVDEAVSSLGLFPLTLFADVVHHLRDISRGGRLLLGVRGTMLGIEELYETSDEVIEVLPLSRTQAESLFPGILGALETIHDERLEKILLTPLTLVHLGPRINTLMPEQLSSRVRIFEAAIEILLVQSGVTQSASEGIGRRTQTWADALSIVAWLFFSNFRGSLSRQSLESEVQELWKSWAQNLSNQDVITTRRLTEAFQLLRNGVTLSVLLGRTVFTSVGAESIRFRHREWEDYLVSRYIAHCMSCANVLDLGRRGFNKEIYVAAAEQIEATGQNRETGPSILSAEFASKLRAITDRRERAFAIVNASGVVGNGRVPLDEQGLRAVIQMLQEPDCSEVAKHVTINATSTRLLRNDPQDSWVLILRRVLIPYLQQVTSQANKGAANALTGSLAWCYLYALGAAQPAAEKRRLHRDLLASAEDALATVCEITGSRKEVTKQYESVQIAYANYASSALGRPFESIAIVHYLYPVAIALVNGLATPQAVSLLRGIIREWKTVQAQVERMEHVPGVRQLADAAEHLLRSSFSKH